MGRLYGGDAMLYQRSLDIEQRLNTVLRLIRTGRYSTPELADKLGVSVPTISRDVTALRQRGNAIRAERRAGSWRYVLVATAHVRAPQRSVRPQKKKHSSRERPCH
jgi:DeoR/GlpR family transcriptional regulator of sugar metabolism